MTRPIGATHVAATAGAAQVATTAEIAQLAGVPGTADAVGTAHAAREMAAAGARIARDVVIVASGGANIASLQFALERLQVSSIVTADAQRIRAASHVILPGVGAAADAMSRLRRDELHEVLPALRQPVLGICLGMQLLFEASDEGATKCLGIIPGRASRFPEAPGRPVPHIGWNTVDVERDSALLAGLGRDDYAYFVHSYALPVSDATIASTRYGDAFTACVEWKNFYGTQFHPERSAAVGSRLLRNFLDITVENVGSAPRQACG